MPWEVAADRSPCVYKDYHPECRLRRRMNKKKEINEDLYWAKSWL
jgi:hypothetical protein